MSDWRQDIVPRREGVPEYACLVRRERSSRFATIVFALNEGQRLVSQLGRMAIAAPDCDLVLADGGSSDASLETVLGSPVPSLRTVLVNRGERGLGVQMRMAFDYLVRAGYDGAVVIDGNGKDDVAAVPGFLGALEAGCDHIQGSRFIPGGRAINTPFVRLLGLRLIHRPLLRVAAGFPYTDTTNGFRAYSSRLLTDPRIAVFRSVFVGYELHYYLAIKAARLRFRVGELPVTRAYPGGAVPTKIRGVRGNVAVLLALLRAVTGAYDPHPAQ